MRSSIRQSRPPALQSVTQSEADKFIVANGCTPPSLDAHAGCMMNPVREVVSNRSYQLVAAGCFRNVEHQLAAIGSDFVDASANSP